MKKFILGFLRRGFTAAGIGPLILAIVYLIFQHTTGTDTVTVKQVCTGIFSLSALAFIAGGMNAIYQIEHLPLMTACLLHGCVLYVSYLATYLFNDWLALGSTPIIVFTGIFVAGYVVIWIVIYAVMKKNTTRLNQLLKEKQKKI